MKRFFVLVLLSICLINLAFAQQMATIDPELYALMNGKSGEKINVNIILKEKVDASELNVRSTFSSRDDKRAAVVEELKARTEKSQADLMKTLNANERSIQVTDIKCYWITNMITCNATPYAILKIAEHPDVEAVFYNKKQKLIYEDAAQSEVVDKAVASEGIYNGTNVEKVNAHKVWDLGYTGEGIIVAVIDTGVNADHVDLKDHLWSDSLGRHGKNTLDDNYDITDRDGHGTHCAGTVCGDGSSGTITGMAPDAKLMTVKALGDEGEGTVESIIAGVEYAVTNGADVLSMSLGFANPGSYLNEIMRPVFENTLTLDIVAAVAAGNDGNRLIEYPRPYNVNSPGNCPPPWIHPDQQSNVGGKTSVISVGAVDYSDVACGFSSEGPVTWQNTSYGDYRLGGGYPVKTLRYDDDTYAWNYDGTTASEFAVMFPPAMLTGLENGGKLVSVSIMDGYFEGVPADGGYIIIYEGGNDPSKGTEKYSQQYALSGSGDMHEIVITGDVQINTNENLWVVFQSWVDGSYPIPVAKNQGDKNGCWVLRNGKWTNDYIVNSIKVHVNISTSNVKEEEKVGLIRPDVCAPGYMVQSTSNTDNNYYEWMSGTSQATPCVAGTIALLLDANPALTPADICRVLEETAVKVGGATTKSNKTGSGRIDAYNAVLAVATNLELTAPTLTATAKSSSRIDLSWTVTPGAESYTIYRNEDVIASGITTTSYSDTDLNPATTYSYEIEAIRDSESVKSSVVSVTTLSESAAIAGKYRIKVATSSNGTTGKYFHINSTAAPSGSTNVVVSAYTESDNQIFTIESADGGNYYLRSENGYYIKCDDQPNVNNRNTWNVYAYSTTDKTPVYFDYTGTDGVSFYIRDYDKKVGNGSSSNNLPNSNYFKVQDSKIYCDAPLSNTDVVTWILEPVGTSGDDDDDEGGNDNIVGEEQVVTIGGDVNSNNTSSGLPINAYYCYTFSQQIYTQSEIGTGAGTITKLAFKKQTDRNANRKIKVYMQNTSKASFANVKDWVSMTDADKVFEGEEVNLSGENNDLELTLNTPFSYTGENLLISVCDYTGTASSPTSFYTYSTSEARSIFVRSDGTSYDPSNMSSIQGNLTNVNNIIDITIETVLSSDVPSSPENLVATVQGTTSIALSWDAVDGATSYNVYRNSSVNPIVNVATGTSYTDTNLTPATNYCYTVSAVNTNGESAKSTQVCETTEAESETPSVSQYRIKAVGRSASAGVSYYLNIENNDQHQTGSKGGVGLAKYAENDSQIFEIEEVYGSQVYVKSASGYYIYCNGDWNVDAFSTYSATSLELEDAGDGAYYLRNSNGYFKVDPDAGGSGKYYPYSNGSKSDREKWILEPVGSSTPEPEEPTVPDTQGCNVIFTLEDSYGDSWNAGYMHVSYTDYEETLEHDNGGSTVYERTIPQGTEVTVYVYSGSYPKEIGFTIEYEEGEIIEQVDFKTLEISNYKYSYTFTVDCGIVEEMYEEFSGSGNWNYATNWSTNALPDENSNVSVSGDVIINSDVTVKTLVINDGGSVTLESGSLTVTDGMTNNDASAFIINDGAQVVQGNDNVKATFRMNVEAPESWTEDHSNGWQFIASPMKDFLSSKFETEGIEYDLFKYDGTKEMQWVNYKEHADFDTTFQQGRGYLASYATDSVVEFAGVLNNKTEFTFDEINMFNGGDHYANFYLLGNPFAFNMDWANVTAEGLASGLAVVTLDGNYKYAVDTVINVGDGFFVMVTGAEPSLTYNSNVRSRRVKHNFINIMASSKAGSDNVILNFADNDEEGFAKLENFNKEIAEIYVKEDNRRYGIMNYEKDVEEIELYFDAKKMGNYTINAVTNAVFSNVTLVDRFTGIETNLLASSYTFQATANDNQDRFMLRMSREVENENFVYQSGDELIIKAKGAVQIIDVMGRVVYSADVINNNHKINLSNYDNAAYIVRVVNVNEVKTQKIIVY